MKPLVVYYSLTDKTKLVAQVIAEALNATLSEIKEPKQDLTNSIAVLQYGGKLGKVGISHLLTNPTHIKG